MTTRLPRPTTLNESTRHRIARGLGAARRGGWVLALTLTLIAATRQPSAEAQMARPVGLPGATDLTAAKASATRATSAAPIDVNHADETSLQSLPGVGPALASQIVAGRPYASVDDLSRVKGIGPAKLAALRNLVTTGGGMAAAPAGSTPSTPPTPSARPKMPTMPSMPSSPPVTMPSSSMPRMPSAATTTSTTSTSTTTTSRLGKLAAGQKVNINTASAAELDALPGIGPSKSQAIVAGRPYSKIEDVMKVKGIKGGVFAKIKDFITVQ